MSYENSVRNLCFIWPAAFVRMHVYLLFVTIWVYAWEYVSYECHWSSVVAEAKLKTSAWGYFVYFCVVNSLPQVDASWISAITHNPFSGTSESFIKPPTGHVYVAVLQLPKRVMSGTITLTMDVSLDVAREEGRLRLLSYFCCSKLSWSRGQRGTIKLAQAPQSIGRIKNFEF